MEKKMIKLNSILLEKDAEESPSHVPDAEESPSVKTPVPDSETTFFNKKLNSQNSLDSEIPSTIFEKLNKNPKKSEELLHILHQNYQIFHFKIKNSRNQ